MNNHPSKMQGFSLLEIIVVIIITTMFMTSAIHYWSRYQQRLLLQQTTQQLISFLLYQQRQARWHNRVEKIDIKGIETSAWLLQNSHEATGNCAIPSKRCFVVSTQNIILTYTTFLNGISFYGLRGSATPGHLLISNNVTSHRIIISARGRIRWCEERYRSIDGGNTC